MTKDVRWYGKNWCGYIAKQKRPGPVVGWTCGSMEKLYKTAKNAGWGNVEYGEEYPVAPEVRWAHIVDADGEWFDKVAFAKLYPNAQRVIKARFLRLRDTNFTEYNHPFLIWPAEVVNRELSCAFGVLRTAMRRHEVREINGVMGVFA